MEREVAFKRGCDLRERTLSSAADSIACESCGARAESDAAGNLGWQVRPPVCPDCLRWSSTARSRVADLESGIRIERYRRFWAVFENGELLCVTVYRKGATAVAERIRKLGAEANHGSN
jgi:hypothetical protein